MSSTIQEIQEWFLKLEKQELGVQLASVKELVAGGSLSSDQESELKKFLWKQYVHCSNAKDNPWAQPIEEFYKNYPSGSANMAMELMWHLTNYVGLSKKGALPIALESSDLVSVKLLKLFVYKMADIPVLNTVVRDAIPLMTDAAIPRFPRLCAIECLVSAINNKKANGDTYKIVIRAIKEDMELLGLNSQLSQRDASFRTWRQRWEQPIRSLVAVRALDPDWLSVFDSSETMNESLPPGGLVPAKHLLYKALFR